MTLRSIDDPKHWRDRADETLSCADDMRDPFCRRQMIRIAAGYEVLALRAEERLTAAMAERARGK